MKNNNEKYTYPEIRVERPNIEYAKILLQDYAGAVSEDTAIHLYMYQSILQDDKWEDFAETLEEIAIVEMRHLEILGRLITKLGLNPIYATADSSNDNIIYWTSENIDYTDEIKKMLQVDIKAETLAIEQYELHKEMIDDKYIREILDVIIEQEKEHLKIFSELYEMVLEKNV